MAVEPQFQTVEGTAYRTVTLDEWLLPLAADHPARQELIQLRLQLAGALEAIDTLEKENAAANAKLIKLRGGRKNTQEEP